MSDRRLTDKGDLEWMKTNIEAHVTEDLKMEVSDQPRN